ncbi:hypothetical protein GOL82_28215 [Sinorhizobium medicae]|nr:hypothetical protein [Sinorhizobium medicae]MDX0420210.1 hypothetical protein [Sinorhizobium medicae]MDX1035035.1 hypothetical protein [Sinorhizobium medicae]
MSTTQGKQAFRREEYLRRLDMGERGVDVLVVTQPANITYVSGYAAFSAYVP